MSFGFICFLRFSWSGIGLSRELIEVVDVCDLSDSKLLEDEMLKTNITTAYKNLKNNAKSTPAPTSERRISQRRATFPQNQLGLWEEGNGEYTSPVPHLTQDIPKSRRRLKGQHSLDCSCSVAAEVTLLEKAEEFKKQKPELWEERKKEREKRILESSQSSEKMEDFLSSYYEEQEENLKKRKEKELKRKYEVPKLEIQLKYQNLPDSVSSSNLLKHLCEENFENFNIFEKEKYSDIFSCENFEDQSTNNSEFHIMISKGKYLLNYLKTGAEKYNDGKVRCYFYLGKNNEEKVLKSRPVYVTTKGKAKWDHVFILRGYTLSELEMSYVNLVVTGNTKDGKQAIGSSVLSGKYARVWDEKTCSFRNPAPNEVVHWEEALFSPRTAVCVSLDLNRPTSFGTDNLFISLTQAFTDLQTQRD